MTRLFKTETQESFEERVDMLFRELELALKWDRPSILLAIYASDFVCTDAQFALTARLRELGQTTTFYSVDEENADIPFHLAEHPDRAHTVFFVWGLQYGGGVDGRNAYRALNIRREYFVDYHLRAVFWLTEAEAIALPKYAPDFWAFRHRVIEFMDRPEPHAAKIGRALAWSDFDDRTLREDTDAKIELRLALLKDLPEGDETLAARAELQFTLAGLYWAKGKYEDSIRYFQDALQGAEQLQDMRLQAMCHHGLGNVYYQLGNYEAALAAYQRAIELDPKDAYPHNNMAGIFIKQGKFDEARRELNERIRLAPENTFTPLVTLGVLARHQGLPESDKHLQDALAQWDAAWRARWQSPAGLLENKAIALLCLGNKDQALQVLKEAIAQMTPGGEIEFDYYTLLQTAPVPPEGVEEMIAMLKEAQEKRGGK